MQHFNCIPRYAEYERIFITLGFCRDGELGEPRLPMFLKGMESIIQKIDLVSLRSLFPQCRPRRDTIGNSFLEL